MATSPVEVVRKAFSHFQKGEIPQIIDLVSDDTDWICPGEPDIPYAGRYRGKEGAMQFFQRMGESTEVLGFQPQELIESGDRVAAFGTFKARAKKTGRTYEVPWAMSFTVRNGRITAWHDYTDTLTTAKAYGAEATRTSRA